MTRVDYDETAAAAFADCRQILQAGLDHWRAAITRHLAPRPGLRMLDLGSGTGTWATAITHWYAINVIAVEPSPAMLARTSYYPTLAGDANAIPVSRATMDAAWLSTVIHHLPDLPAVAAELRRVLRAGSPVLIRSVFPGRHEGITLFRYWPEAIAVLDTFPTVAEVCTAFASAGFRFAALEPVPQVSADSLAKAAAAMRREAHTPLRLISDSEYESGAARLRAAATSRTDPVIDTLDLLVLRRDHDRFPARAAHPAPAATG